MIATAILASHLMNACTIESRTHSTVQAGHVATFEVGDTCLMRGLRVVIRSHTASALTATNPNAGHDLTVSIRIPTDVHAGTRLYAYGFSPATGSRVIALFPVVTITK